MKRWLLNGVLLAVSLAACFGMAEGILRLIDYTYPVFWTYDDDTASRLYPGAEGWFRTEGEAYIKINSAGFRDSEHSKAKTPNTMRVAILGDSMTEALEVPLKKNFSYILEQNLKRCKSLGNRNVEVLNFGVSGYGTAQELLTFQRRVAAYSPDVTVLAFYAGNDVRNNSKELEPNKLRPFFVLRDGKLVLDNGFLQTAEYQSFKSNFERRSRFFGLRTFQLMRELKSVVDQWGEAHANGASHSNLEAGADDQIFLPPASPAWKDAWRVTERLIVSLRDEVIGAGGRFVVLSIPIGIQVYPDPGVRDRFMRSLQLDSLWYPDLRMRAFAEREGVDVIILGQAFQSYADANNTYLYGFRNTRLGTGHLNEAGHKLIAGSLASHLCPAQ